MNINQYQSISTKVETSYLPFLFQYAFENNFSVALWRLPNDSHNHLLISRQPQLLKPDSLLEDLPAGFMFAPFNKASERFFLPADFLFSFSNGQLTPPQTPTETDSQTWLDEQQPIATLPLSFKPYTSKLTPFDKPKENFIEVIRAAIQEIEKGTFEKVVPSRTKTISLKSDFEIVTEFHRLCSAYPNALVSFVSCPDTGSWMCASPEILVTVEDKRIFKTVALAGTQPYHEGINVRSVAWTQKEIEEQALVERYIISCFKKIRLREYEEHGPKTVAAGNLMHLKSDFMVDLKETNFPQLGSVMLQLLHPTAAVCGMPLTSSLEFLEKNEGYNRQFYTGYLGPVNVNNNINIFVNLRCMQLLDKKIVLYAGAGVTLDSEPEQEWLETEMKFSTLINVIQLDEGNGH